MNIAHKTLQAGQPRPYADSVFIYTVTTDEAADDQAVWTECQKLRSAQNRDDKIRHDGSCGFPFGLSSFGSLVKTGHNEYRYSVTEPYCD